jgi:hypothetical protein
VSRARRRERLLREAAEMDAPAIWEVVVELAVPDGDNDAALRQIMSNHPELREIPAQDMRVDVLCGRSWSSVRILRRKR